MSLVYIVANAPWGPVRIDTAASPSDLLRQVTSSPAHVEDCGALDAGQVAEATRRQLPAADEAGWIATRVEKATRALQEARAGVSAKVIAGQGAEAAPGSPLSQDGASEFPEHYAHARAEPAFRDQYAHARDGVVTNGDVSGLAAETQGRITERVDPEPPRSFPRRRRSSADADVRAIRAGLKMTQAEFAKAWGFSLAAVRDWEQGRAAPEPSTRVLLAVIGHRPDVVRDAMSNM